MAAEEDLPIRRIMLTLAYDGTDYCGWQVQARDRTVQGDLEEALGKMHKHPVNTTASGRTDSGVHARGQVVHYDTDISSLGVDKIPRALNSLLPGDVRVLTARDVPGDFHARYAARIRVYHYQLRFGPSPDPWARRYSWTMDAPLDPQVLNGMAAQVLGTHDFTAFAAAGDPSPSRVRKILSSGFFPRGPYLVYQVAGTAFLWHMVRSLVGTMVGLARSGGGPEEMKAILEGKDRLAAGTTAPARGLFLEKVLYDEHAAY